jgi:hypothetical protein
MITVSTILWTTMLDAFDREHRAVEQVCYFDGPVGSDGDGIVTTLTLPNAQLMPGQFSVSSDAMSEAGKHLRQFRFRRLAQVHTHPSDWVGHSQWDDAHAYSQLPGAISIVLPHFGRGRPAVERAGIHVRTAEGWQQLDPDRVLQYIRVVPALNDFRVNGASNEPRRVEPPRRRPWWSVLAFWRH